MKNSRILLNMLAMASLTLAGVASAHDAPKGGYLIDARGNVVKNSYNQCWRSGTWTPENAIAECDPDLVKKEAPKPVEVPPPAPVPAPAPAPEPAPVKPAPILVSLQAETLFEFNKAVLTDDGKKVLDNEVVSKMKQFQQIESVQVTGHADRIGSEANNKKLSQGRASAVKAYLVSQGIEENRIAAADKGSSEPLVKCDEVKGKAVPSNKKLVKCLQPNRRVVVEVKALK